MPFVNILNACPDLYDRTMVLNGVSKAYSMTGWRIGYAAGPEDILRAMKNVQSQSTSNPTSISQVAAEAALNGDQGCITPDARRLRRRHRYVVDALNDIPGFKCVDSGGAFYAFPDVRPAIMNLLARDIIEEADRHRTFRIPAGVGRRRRRSRLGLRRRRLYPPVFRHLAGQSGKGAQAHRCRTGLSWPVPRRG